MTIQYIQANKLQFAYQEYGDGPLVILLHGFPDIATTWSHQVPALVAQGYRVVTPYLRGYTPTEIPEGGFYDKATLVEDIAGLIKGLSGGKPVHLVGQDWGAIIAYAVLAAYPELISRAVVMAVPHPGQVTESLVNPKHIHRSFHWWFFQLPDLPEKAILANDQAFIDYLWAYWTIPSHRDEEHIVAVKETLEKPRVLSATLAYYRAMFDVSKADPALTAVREKMTRLIQVPTLALCGREDLRAELMLEQSQYFTNEYEFKLVDNAGHFLHREQPEAVTRLIIDWLKR
ncbi:alpha/beta fold hydrolase [Polynucleobacter asymbioticus]|uniref:Alpha/beta hydrolase fold protein n=1 Tax=Polynucleobacter asymbioticus (strain DSM 18221 / CIP 109841 / QLW-P1DMWA-1) TaxID=312153 RepID=A4SZ48_POLAQ|nr:alpha/beta hydrolase [Polynucleobacter asymbioticus]ABP34762.1 alpha/beta hydrolase fold protein [Polynucleobacter asymbioticus QLW-P1DMWA-1]